MASNFAFLHEKFPELEQLGMLAERYLPSDPQLCLMEAGLLCEGMIRVMCALDHVTLPVPPRSASIYSSDAISCLRI